jgi:hypothetical protein
MRLKDTKGSIELVSARKSENPEGYTESIELNSLKKKRKGNTDDEGSPQPWKYIRTWKP